jgi:NADPH:quinone reductase-like Zn-dependent oxidoreductase
VLKAALWSPLVSQEIGFMMSNVSRDDLIVLRDLMQSGKVTPVIDGRYKLSEVREAIRYV